MSHTGAIDAVATEAEPEIEVEAEPPKPVVPELTFEEREQRRQELAPSLPGPEELHPIDGQLMSTMIMCTLTKEWGKVRELFGLIDQYRLNRGQRKTYDQIGRALVEHESDEAPTLRGILRAIGLDATVMTFPEGSPPLYAPIGSTNMPMWHALYVAQRPVHSKYGVSGSQYRALRDVVQGMIGIDIGLPPVTISDALSMIGESYAEARDACQFRAPQSCINIWDQPEDLWMMVHCFGLADRAEELHTAIQSLDLMDFPTPQVTIDAVFSAAGVPYVSEYLKSDALHPFPFLPIEHLIMKRADAVWQLCDDLPASRAKVHAAMTDMGIDVAPPPKPTMRKIFNRGFERTFSYMGITDVDQIDEALVARLVTDSYLSPYQEKELRDKCIQYDLPVEPYPLNDDTPNEVWESVYDAVPLVHQFPIPTPRRIARVHGGQVQCYPWRYIDGELQGDDLWELADRIAEQWHALGLPGRLCYAKKRGFLCETDGDNKLVFRIEYDNPLYNPHGMFDSNRIDAFCFIVFSERGKTYFSDCNPNTNGCHQMDLTDVRFPYIRQWLECVLTVVSRVAPLQIDTELGVASQWSG